MEPRQYRAIAAEMERELTDWAEPFGQIAKWLYSRQHDWIGSPTTRSVPAPNQNIINPAGQVALQRLAAGLTEGVISRTRKWFALRVPGVDAEQDQEVARWLSETESVLRFIFSNSNFYQAMGQGIKNLAGFGNGAVWIEPDPERVIRATSIPVGEFAFGTDGRGRVRRFLRIFQMPAIDLADRFSRVPDKVKELIKSGGQKAFELIKVYHLVLPDEQVYWCGYNTNDEVLEQTKLDGWPVCSLRWDVVGYDNFGTGPGFDAVRLVKALQQAELAKAKLLDLMTRPPTQADAMLATSGVNLIPGGVTYVNGLAQGASSGIRPIFEINPNAVQVIEQDIQRLVSEIREMFFLDLFMMVSSLDTVRTATEIVERRAEKVTMLGPVLQRIEDEALSPAIIRTFELAQEVGLIPDPPAGVAGGDIQIHYISMLHQAQEASDTVALERGLATVGNLAGLMPSVLDRISPDEVVLTYFEKLGVDPRVVRTDKEVEEIRAQQAEQQAMMQAQQLAQSAKVMSETDVGGGQNALQKLIGTA